MVGGNQLNTSLSQLISLAEYSRKMPRKRRSVSSEDSDDDFDDIRHPQRNAANARERARMRVLSKAFCR